MLKEGWLLRCFSLCSRPWEGGKDEEEDEEATRRWQLRRVRVGYGLWGWCVLCLATFYIYLVYGVIIQVAQLTDYLSPLALIAPLALFLFSVGHALLSQGLLLGLVFLIVTLLLSWSAEEISVASGYVPFGSLTYTDISPVPIHHVPLTIPCSWFMMLYPSYCMADLIVNGLINPRHTNMTAGKILIIAVITGLITTSWDLIADPIGSTQSSIWIWNNYPGAFFGVPLLNFIGWAFVTFIIISFYLFFERFVGGAKPFRPHREQTVPLGIACLPLLAYIGVMFMYASICRPPELAVMAFFMMGFPTFVGTFHLFHSRLQIRSLNSDYDLVYEEQ
jgi:uncharacterized membrane protein